MGMKVTIKKSRLHRDPDWQNGVPVGTSHQIGHVEPVSSAAQIHTIVEMEGRLLWVDFGSRG